MARIVLISPRFEHSYWGLEYMLPITGKRANIPVAALPLLAAITPRTHEVRILDESIEDLDWSYIGSADIVGITGMSVQRTRMKEIVQESKRRNLFTVVGGPWVTVQEDYFERLADVIFIGEAEETWPQFIHDWAGGNWRPRYEQCEKTDMSTVPVPRFDLLKMDKYLSGSIQISRGCPFLCEFCDIIVTFGRRPRLKTIPQVLAELDALRLQKMKSVFIVDDNIIGNKQAIKPILQAIVEYQELHGYPFRLFTEASLDLAEEDELISLMAEANIDSIFIGIETPNEDALKETKKHQNLRMAGGTILDRVRKIQNAGIEVYAGMIVGFDNDTAAIFKSQEDFISKAAIIAVMLGMLYAIPKTPLHSRLSKENRLDTADFSDFGTNVIPMNLSREHLREGYIATMLAIHDPQAFFKRVDHLYLGNRLGRGKLGRTKFIKRNRMRSLKAIATAMVSAVILFKRLMGLVKEKSLREEYRRRLLSLVMARPDPFIFLKYIGKCAFHYHAYKLAHGLRRGPASQSNMNNAPAA